MQEFVIALNDLRYKAFHGLYPQERKEGNDFVVNIEIRYVPAQDVIEDLNDTIDYVVIADITTTIMQEPVDLLETVVQKISAAIFERYSSVNRTTIKIEKSHPPIADFNGSVSVMFDKKRDTLR